MNSLFNFINSLKIFDIDNYFHVKLICVGLIFQYIQYMYFVNESYDINNTLIFEGLNFFQKILIIYYLELKKLITIIFQVFFKKDKIVKCQCKKNHNYKENLSNFNLLLWNDKLIHMSEYLFQIYTWKLIIGIFFHYK